MRYTSAPADSSTLRCEQKERSVSDANYLVESIDLVAHTRSGIVPGHVAVCRPAPLDTSSVYRRSCSSDWDIPLWIPELEQHRLGSVRESPVDMGTGRGSHRGTPAPCIASRIVS